MQYMTKKYVPYILVAAGLAIVVSFSFTSATVDIAVDWVSKPAENCITVNPNNPQTVQWVANITNGTNNGVHLNKVAYHDFTAGCDATTSRPTNPNEFYQISRSDYPAGSSGQTTLSFNTAKEQCGRIQLDSSFIDDATGEDKKLFVGAIINYGVNCGSDTGSQPTPTPEPAQNWGSITVVNL